MNNTFLTAYRVSLKSFSKAMLKLIKSFKYCVQIGLKGNYYFSETEAFDALIIKLTRNSDVFFQQIVKGYFKLKGEDGLLFIDRLNLLERLGVIDNIEQLMVLKSFRNQVVHKYSAIEFKELYKESLLLTPFFQQTVNDFSNYIGK